MTTDRRPRSPGSPSRARREVPRPARGSRRGSSSLPNIENPIRLYHGRAESQTLCLPPRGDGGGRSRSGAGGWGASSALEEGAQRASTGAGASAGSASSRPPPGVGRARWRRMTGRGERGRRHPGGASVRDRSQSLTLQCTALSAYVDADAGLQPASARSSPLGRPSRRRALHYRRRGRAPPPPPPPPPPPTRPRPRSRSAPKIKLCQDSDRARDRHVSGRRNLFHCSRPTRRPTVLLPDPTASHLRPAPRHPPAPTRAAVGHALPRGLASLDRPLPPGSPSPTTSLSLAPPSQPPRTSRRRPPTNTLPPPPTLDDRVPRRTL